MKNESLSLSTPKPSMTTNAQRLSVGVFSAAVLLFLVVFSTGQRLGAWVLPLAVFLCLVSAGIFIQQEYSARPEGIKNNGVWFKSISSRGIGGWFAGLLLTGFYVLLYWFPTYLGLGADGAANTGLVALFDPLSLAMRGKPAEQWFLYGTLYTVAILIMGLKFIYKYRHNKYQIIRTVSVMFFQLVFAYLIPEILGALNSDLPYFGKDLKNVWPLDYDLFAHWHLDNMQKSGSLGMFFLVWGIILTLVITPVLSYFFGKRWYCSWVCGCGGLAETAGDPFRQLSDKSTEAWQIERYLIHGVLLFVVLATALLLYTYFGGVFFEFSFSKYSFFALIALVMSSLYIAHSKFYPKHSRARLKWVLPSVFVLIVARYEWKYTNGGPSLYFNTSNFYEWYGFFIGATFSGVIGVGFYPIMGSRVWCRFGCPMAAILGIFQKKKSRFRITTNGGQCISCGNCSTYCEMGIDVRHYAQRGQDIVRASCVGCGICSAVCPRGVLRLENAAADVQSRGEEVRNFGMG